MNHEKAEGLAKQSNKEGNQSRDRECGVSRTKVIPMVEMAGMEGVWIMSWLVILSMSYVLTTANGFLFKMPASFGQTTKQKADSTVTLFEISFKNRGEEPRYTNDESKNPVDPFFQKQGDTKTSLFSHNTQSQKALVFPRDTLRGTPMIDRCTMNSVPTTRRTLGMVFGGGLTGAILSGSLPTRAIVAVPPNSIGENSDEVPSISFDRRTLQIVKDDIVDLPLEFIPTLGAYVVRYFLFDEPFAAIVDTGSPFLTVPCYCRPYRNRKMFWGCYKPELTRDSGYGNTIEGFDNNYGTVVWRKAGFSFSPSAIESEEGSTVSSDTTTDVVFGVLDRDLLNGPGGVFFGLIKETDRWIRPSFLGQTGYTSFCVDLRHNTDTNNDDSLGTTPRLVLSKQSMIRTGKWRGVNSARGIGETTESQDETTESQDWIPLVRDLKKKYGAPVVHYTAKATSFVVNGLPLLINKKKPLYVIFDTGVSGMVVSQELFDGRYLQARKNREKSLWGTVEVSFLTNSGRTITLNATKPITTPLGKATPWKGFKGNLIAVGLAFLDGFATTVDVDDGKILFVEG